MDIRPIRTEEDYAWALAEIEKYFDSEPAPGTPDADRFDVLSDLIDAYEARRWHIEGASPLDILRTVMAQCGYSQSDLATVIGSRSRASELLNGQRGLSLAMVHRISTAWNIPAGLLVRPEPNDRSAA